MRDVSTSVPVCDALQSTHLADMLEGNAEAHGNEAARSADCLLCRSMQRPSVWQSEYGANESVLGRDCYQPATAGGLAC